MNQFWFRRVSDLNMDVGVLSLPARMIVEAPTREAAIAALEEIAQGFGEDQQLVGRLHGPCRTRLEAETLQIHHPVMMKD